MNPICMNVCRFITAPITGCLVSSDLHICRPTPRCGGKELSERSGFSSEQGMRATRYMLWDLPGNAICCDLVLGVTSINGNERHKLFQAMNSHTRSLQQCWGTLISHYQNLRSSPRASGGLRIEGSNLVEPLLRSSLILWCFLLPLI